MYSQDKFVLWKQRIQIQKTSGMTVHEWCEKNQLSRHAYYYWHKIVCQKVSIAEQISEPVFVEVPKQKQLQHHAHTVTVNWKDSTITLSGKQDIDLVADLIHVLQEEC